MIQILNDIESLKNQDKDQMNAIRMLFTEIKLLNDQYRLIIMNSSEEKQGNLFQKKISKNLHSIILSYLSFNDIMRLKLVNQYNRDMVLFQYPELIQRYQQKLSQLKEQQQNIVIDEQQVQQIITEYCNQLNKYQMTEFFSFKNPHKLVEDVQIALFQLLTNTAKCDYQNQVKQYFKANQNQIINQIINMDVKMIKEQVLNSIRTLITEENQAQIQTISSAANGFFRYIKGIHLLTQLPQNKILRDLKQVENILKILSKVKE